MNQITARIERCAMESADVRLFDLVGDAPLPSFAPGAHIDVRTRTGHIRQYSLCNSPADSGRYQIAVKRDARSRGGSVSMHDDLAEGDRVVISAPRNLFALAQAAGHHLLLGGGIGITPLLSMARHLAANGHAFSLHYYVSTPPGQTAFAEALRDEALRDSAQTFHGLDAAQVRETLQHALEQCAAGTHVYVCGPAPFMELASTLTAGWPTGTVHMERFAVPEADAVAANADVPFDVRIASTGTTYHVAANETIVKALARHRVQLETSCEQGICGTCLTGVLEGMPDHRDSILSDDERAANDRIIACVSRCRGGTLVLDL